MTTDLERLREFQRDVEEAEGRCCPEDVGFEEWIGILQKRLAEAEANAARYRWLRERYYGLDFGWQNADDEAMSVIVFKIPDGMRFSADLDRTIDDARLCELDQAK